MKRSVIVLLIMSAALMACGGDMSWLRARDPTFRRGWDSAFEKYLFLAESGDPVYQNLVGYILFRGDGVPVSYADAHSWFHKAASQGHPPARRNLAIMHWYGIGVSRDRDEARLQASAGGITDMEKFFRDVPVSVHGTALNIIPGDPGPEPPGHPGEETYAKFCAGCHGRIGIAAYPGSPSFALGERLDKPDSALLDSIRNGKDVMPDWGNKLPPQRIRDVLSYVRTLEQRYRSGLSRRNAPSASEYYYRFGPMREIGYRNPI